MDLENGANGFTIEELEALMSDSNQATPPEPDANNPQAEDGNNGSNTTNPANSVDQTKAFAHRLKESTEKARNEERENIAKSLGYDSYEVMMKEREQSLLQEGGLDPEKVSPIVDKLVKARLDNDPRMKELDEFKKKQIAEFAKNEIAEISKLTDGEITDVKQLPKEVLDLWAKKGSLKSAYLELEGEKLITKMKSEQSKGTMTHMQQVSGGTDPSGSKHERPLTDDEKKYWKFFNPNISDEELNKKRVEC